MERCTTSVVEGVDMVGAELVNVEVAGLAAVRHIMDEEVRMMRLDREEAVSMA